MIEQGHGTPLGSDQLNTIIITSSSSQDINAYSHHLPWVPAWDAWEEASTATRLTRRTRVAWWWCWWWGGSLIIINSRSPNICSIWMITLCLSLSVSLSHVERVRVPTWLKCDPNPHLGKVLQCRAAVPTPCWPPLYTPHHSLRQSWSSQVMADGSQVISLSVAHHGIAIIRREWQS